MKLAIVMIDVINMIVLVTTRHMGFNVRIAILLIIVVLVLNIIVSVILHVIVMIIVQHIIHVLHLAHVTVLLLVMMILQLIHVLHLHHAIAIFHCMMGVQNTEYVRPMKGAFAQVMLNHRHVMDIHSHSLLRTHQLHVHQMVQLIVQVMCHSKLSFC